MSKSRLPLLAFTVPLLIAAQVTLAAAAPEAIDLPPTIQRGLSKFQTTGGAAAVKVWTRGGPLESKAETSVERKLEGIQKSYGRYQGYSVIEQIDLSSASQLIYLEIEMDKGPAYIRFRLFTGTFGTHVIGLKVDSAPEGVLPAYVLEHKGILGAEKIADSGGR